MAKMPWWQRALVGAEEHGSLAKEQPRRLSRSELEAAERAEARREAQEAAEDAEQRELEAAQDVLKRVTEGSGPKDAAVIVAASQTVQRILTKRGVAGPAAAKRGRFRLGLFLVGVGAFVLWKYPDALDAALSPLRGMFPKAAGMDPQAEPRAQEPRAPAPAAPPTQPTTTATVEEVKPGSLGVDLMATAHMTQEERRTHGVGDVSGVRVVSVVPGSAAERIGLKKGDIILSVNGSDVTATPQVISAIRGAGAGNVAQVLVSRAGERVVFSPVLGAAPPVEESKAAASSAPPERTEESAADRIQRRANEMNTIWHSNLPASANDGFRQRPFRYWSEDLSYCSNSVSKDAASIVVVYCNEVRYAAGLIHDANNDAEDPYHHHASDCATFVDCGRGLNNKLGEYCRAECAAAGR